MAVPSAPVTPILQTGNGKILISWDLVATATSYKVQRSLDGVSFSALSSPSVNYYLDSSVSVGTNYFYQVAATNGSGDSAYTASYPAAIVPCLPGQINLGYLRYMSQLRADKLNSQYLTTDEWNFNINQSANGLYDTLVGKFGDDYFFAPKLQIPLTGLDSYPLPDGSNYLDNSNVPAPAIYKLNGVDVNISGASSSINAGWVPVSRFNWSDRDNYTTYPGQAGALNNVFALSYREMGSNIEIIPANTNQVIRLNYVPILTQMLQDTDMLPFSISGWSEWVINDAAMKAMVKEESFEKWQALDAANAKILERIDYIASNRDVGQPNTVSNVRRTMGDPGFSNGWNGGVGFGSGGFGGGF